jgi:hypothetical protein
MKEERKWKGRECVRVCEREREEREYVCKIVREYEKEIGEGEEGGEGGKGRRGGGITHPTSTLCRNPA